MAFDSVFQFKQGDEGGKNRFLLEHYLEHMEIYRALAAQGIATVNYPIQTMEEPNEWLAAHQTMSQSVWSGIGGGQSTDLGRVDWNDAQQMQDWMVLHRDWHRSVRNSLGL